MRILELLIFAIGLGLSAWLSQAAPLETAAAAFSLVSVVLTIRQHIWNFPVGIVGCLLYLAVFFRVKLYSDAALQIAFTLQLCFGWLHWLRGGPANGPLMNVSIIGARARLGWLALAAVAIAIHGTLMDRYTDAALPHIDGAIAVLSLIAQWFLAKKWLEAWPVWIAVDVIAIGVYAAKGLWLSAVVYAVFLVLATLGLVEWYRAFQSSKKTAAGTESRALGESCS